MISAIVLAPTALEGGELATEREIIARSMVWLVSAVVSAVVRDVTLATPAGLGLSDLSDQSGCELVQAETEPERLLAAAAACRETRVLVMRAGFQPDAGVVEEIEAFARRSREDDAALLLERPVTLPQRVFPRRATVAGVLVPKTLAMSIAQGGGGFDRLAGAARRRGTLFEARVRPIS